MKIAIVEKEKALAMHQTGHNSGVVHAGIYYTPGSIKVWNSLRMKFLGDEMWTSRYASAQAKLCVEGLKLSYEYFCKNGLPHNKVGKLIVAQTPEQVKRISDLYDRGLKNDVPDLQLVDKDCIENYEPKCKVRTAREPSCPTCNSKLWKKF